MSYEKSIHEVLERLYLTRELILKDREIIMQSYAEPGTISLDLAFCRGALETTEDLINFITLGDKDE